MKRWVMLGCAIIAEVIGTMSLRAMVDQPGWLPVVILGYVVAFALLAMTLRAGLGIGAAYSIWGASGVALTAVFGAVLFEERLGSVSIAGLVLIIVGVVLIEGGARDGEKARRPSGVRS